MKLLAAGAAIALTSVASAGVLNYPDHWCDTRSPLASPAPAEFGRAKVISTDAPPLPLFHVAGPIYSRTPVYPMVHDRADGSYYGAAPSPWWHAYARVGVTPIRFNPFRDYCGNVPRELTVARNLWLIEHGYVRRARLIARHRPDAAGAAANARPEPAAIFRIAPTRRKAADKPATLEAHRVAPDRVVITSSNLGDETVVTVVSLAADAEVQLASQ